MGNVYMEREDKLRETIAALRVAADESRRENQTDRADHLRDLADYWQGELREAMRSDSGHPPGDDVNGHPDWTHWNVSLWINNDEGFYKWARELTRAMGPDQAAREVVTEMDGEETPDGAKYTFSAVRAALQDILD